MTSSRSARRAAQPTRRTAQALAVPSPRVPVPPLLVNPQTGLPSTLTTQQAQALDALTSLRAAAPVLHTQPELMAELRHILRQSEGKASALATGNAWTGMGTPADLFGAMFTRASGNGAFGSGSPTQSTPLGSSPSGYLGGWAGTKDQPKGVMNARVLRNFSRDPWVFAARKHRVERVVRSDIDVVPIDPDKPFDKAVQARIIRMLNCPNEYRDSYASLMTRVVDDLLVLDRGCISKAMTLKRQPVGLYSEDGATIKIYANWDGDPRVARYLYEEPGSMVTVPLLNDELICVMENETTYGYGLSRVQILLDDIQADIEATKHARDFILHKPAQHAIQLPGAGREDLAQLRADYEALIAGKREILFLGGENEMKAQSLVFSLKDQQFLEWQTYLARKICAVFQVSPQSVGITFDVNRATADSQASIEEDAGTIPLLLRLERYLNRELLWDFAPPHPQDGLPDFDALNLAIKYPEITEAARIMHVERLVGVAQASMSGLPFATPNYILAMLGQEPVPGGNTFYVPTATGPVPWLSYDGETGEFSPYMLGGELGAQEPGGGPDDEESELNDTRQSKPAPGPSTGAKDESSGDGQQPNMPTDDAASAQGSAPAADTKALRPAPGYRPPAPGYSPLRRTSAAYDRRRPGQMWHPALDYEPAPPTHLGAAPHPASGLRPTQPGADALLPRAHPQPPAPAPDTATLTAITTAFTEALIGVTEALVTRAPRPLGRVSAIAEQAHHRPHDEVEARETLRTAVRSIFEGAARRGAQEMTAVEADSAYPPEAHAAGDGHGH